MQASIKEHSAEGKSSTTSHRPRTLGSMASFVRDHRVLFAVLRVVGAIVLGVLLLMAIVRLAQGQFDWVVLDVIVVVLAAAAAIARVVMLLRESGKKHDPSVHAPE